MSELMQHTLSVFLGFFAIMNPIANTAVFVGLTGTKPHSTQKKIAYKALLISFCIIVAFALLGKSIFHLFGITLPALKITGGVLVFLIGYQMLHGESAKMHSPQEIVKVIGASGLSIVTRLMGLILAVIGTQMLITGILNVVN